MRPLYSLFRGSPIGSLLGVLLLLCLPGVASAAEVDGARMGLLWAVPFAGILLSIAVLPIFAASLWHHHFGKITLGWTLLFVVPFSLTFGGHASLGLGVHVLLAEYLPFIILLFALFTISGGILVEGNLHGSPWLNTRLLALGALLASVMGTTGAAMLLIRPLLRANDNRKHSAHVVVFFIFLVANVGGGLTPLGDPPLFLGFLKGVSFLWTLQHMALPVVLLAVPLLGVFYLIDRHYYRRENELLANDPTPDTSVRLLGKRNFVLLAGVVLAVLMSGVWKPGIGVELMGTYVEVQNLLRDGVLVGLALLSLWLTPRALRTANEFDWGPIVEVAKLFAGIFLTIAPVIAILRAGSDGQLAALVASVSGPGGEPINSMYFWLSGTLSSFLDNAPTYLLFFNMAAGDAQVLMEHMPQTLLAISMGSVFMGAMTYIGNAPNFMVKAIAEQRGVKMPSFFGYMGWSCAVLLPLLVVLVLVML
ncbi:sodium:proton antiporter [Pseudomonas aegrilactucae]|uniref:Sodium:proton antiporter n=1 Tax=Pseudomonas aegrilactucae TaxID=2854028 RepID=A0A9Q3AC28_9PSED|nr:sodium:proton antiporter [Pseudomonas aegrilactucae]MBV6285663.1 sodium:proton antiporter [Pseudomonas aegrilactucae]